jgi:hypothetical protein
MGKKIPYSDNGSAVKRENLSTIDEPAHQSAGEVKMYILLLIPSPL